MGPAQIIPTMMTAAVGAVALDQAPTVSIHFGRQQGAVIHHGQELGTMSCSQRCRKAGGAHLHRQLGDESLMVGRRACPTGILWDASSHRWALDRPDGRKGQTSRDKEERDAPKDEVIVGAGMVTGERLGDWLGAPCEGEGEQARVSISFSYLASCCRVTSGSYCAASGSTW
jgi:hypothetical protein